MLQDRCLSDVQDLIRLDSTNSDDDFDPLLSKSSSSVAGNDVNASGAPRQMSQSLHATDLASEGLSNPLYPYFAPQHQRKSEPTTQVRFYFL